MEATIDASSTSRAAASTGEGGSCPPTRPARGRSGRRRAPDGASSSAPALEMSPDITTSAPAGTGSCGRGRGSGSNGAFDYVWPLLPRHLAGWGLAPSYTRIDLPIDEI